MGRPNDEHDWLRRLDADVYRGDACVHWSLTMEDRKTGWLIPIFYYKFRELLTHTMFRFGLCCPIYCCMPDHLHLLWLGLAEGSDQRNAMKYFRRQLNPVLEKLGAALQKQPYDHVLRPDERQPTAFAAVVEYIARNPERAGLVGLDQFREYSFTNCLLPGYPEVTLWQTDFWERFDRIASSLRKQGFQRIINGPENNE
jgi:REP element-mobilizing transposase RayT